MALELTEEQVKAGWTVQKLGNVTTKIGSGATPRGGKSVYIDEGAALVRSQNVYDHELIFEGIARIDEDAEKQLRNVKVQGCDILLNITGDSIARCAYVKPVVEDAYVNQHVCIVRVDPAKADYLYIQKYLAGSLGKKRLLDMSDGATRKALTKKALEEFEVALPPREEQKRVAEILGSLDDKIEANNALIDSLEQLVDLQVAQARENSDELVTISDLAVQVKAQTLPSKETSGKVLHYSLPAFDAGRVASEEPADSILSNKFVVNRPAVLFSKLNPGTPRIWMIEPDSERLNFASTEFVVLEPRPGVDLGSLWAACRDPRVSRVLVEYARGTSSSHQRVSPKDIMSAKVVDVHVPEAQTKLIRDLIAENVTLAKTRDLLIRKLIK